VWAAPRTPPQESRRREASGARCTSQKKRHGPTIVSNRASKTAARGAVSPDTIPASFCWGNRGSKMGGLQIADFSYSSSTTGRPMTAVDLIDQAARHSGARQPRIG
jgi:hypothetical protein